MGALRTTLAADDGPDSEPSDSRQPALFLAFDRDGLGGGPARYLLGDVAAASVGRGPSRRAETTGTGGARSLQIAIPDPRISAAHFSIRRTASGWELIDAGARNGTFLNRRRIDTAPLDDGDVIEAGRSFFVFRRALAVHGCAPVADAPELDWSAPGLATIVPQLAAELARLRRVARGDLSITLQGESGTGKELLASAVHKLSGRSGPFLALNCGALAPTLIASELFGYRKGAFSGADEDRPGLFRSADGGTLFLDEVGDLPLEAQSALLRTLQEKEVLPIGATRPVHVDVRVVCATSRDLASLAKPGRFRRDLYERLAGYTAALPPLRDRVEDIGLITMAVLRRLAPERADEVRFTADAAYALLTYEWPGNVRELENCLRAAMLLAGSDPVALAHLAPGPRRSVERTPAEPAGSAASLTDAQRRRRSELMDLLTANGGNVSAVARHLGKDRVQVQRWLKRLDLDARTFRR
jgi:DNA-binding NtrC family response regulator